MVVVDMTPAVIAAFLAEAVFMQVASANPNLVGTGDFATVRPFFQEYIASFKLQERLTFVPNDFFKGPLPNVDVLVRG
jgi:hypothetical protein